MLLVFLMFALAWWQAQTSEPKQPWFYAAVLAGINALLSLLFGTPLLPVLISAVIMGLIFWLYYFLLDHFTDNVALWWLVLLLFPASMLILPVALMRVLS